MFYILFLISCNFSLIYFVIFYKQNLGFVVFLFVLRSIILLFCTLFNKIHLAEIQVDSEAASRSGETFRSRGDFHSGAMKSKKQLSYLIKILFITYIIIFFNSMLTYIFKTSFIYFFLKKRNGCT